MQFIKALPTLALLLSATVSALPSDLSPRQSSTYCGSQYYSSSAVSSAANAACGYVQDDSTAGGSTYPHQYNNYEGFDFPVSGPWYEFPIVPGHTYTGGSPGADRVVINANCQYAGAITHTGASGNNFVGCSGTS